MTGKDAGPTRDLPGLRSGTGLKSMTLGLALPDSVHPEGAASGAPTRGNTGFLRRDEAMGGVLSRRVCQIRSSILLV